jgi:hypothetical protein
MGVRIDAYAVDLPPFAAFLNTTLGDLLHRYQRDGKDPGERLMFTGVDNDDTFFASPGGSLGAWIGSGSDRHLEELTEERIRKIDALQSPAREHLSGGSIFQASWLLRGFSNCRGIDFVERLIDGQRLPWIGSVLQFAHSHLERGEYEELEHLCRRILRGATCGYKIPEGDVGFVADGLPFTPQDDADLRFGRWSQEESFAAAVLLSKLVELSPAFTPPPELIRLYAGDREWHEWAHRNVGSLLRIPSLNYSVCSVLTFMG